MPFIPGYKDGRICPYCVAGWVLLALAGIAIYHNIKKGTFTNEARSK